MVAFCILQEEILVKPTCSQCGTNDFSVPGKVFTLALCCSECKCLFCVKCAARKKSDGIEVFACPRCGSTSIGAVQADNGVDGIGA